MFQEIEKLYNQAHQLETDRFIHNDLFSFQWWIIFIVNAISIVILLFLIDRKRIIQIALSFMICFIISGIFDETGEYFGLWSYKHEFIQFSHRFNAADFAVVPVAFSLIYQIFRTWGRYLIADIVISFIFSFVGLPLFVYLDITKLNNWTYFNSFLVLLLIGVLVKIIVDFITMLKLQMNHSEKSESKVTFNLIQRKKKAR